MASVTYLGEVLPDRVRPKYLILMVAGMCVAVTVHSSFALGIFPLELEYNLFDIIILRPWRLFIISSNLTGVLALVILIFLPESPKFLLSSSKHEEALRTLQKIHKWNNSEDV